MVRRRLFNPLYIPLILHVQKLRSWLGLLNRGCRGNVLNSLRSHTAFLSVGSDVS